MPGHDGGSVMISLSIRTRSSPRATKSLSRGVFLCFLMSCHAGAQNKGSRMHISKRLLLGLGVAGLIMESVVVQPAFAADKVSLFKVITTKDEVVIGLSDDELIEVDGKNAGGIAKMLVAKGSMSVWQYAVHKSASGDLEQAPLHRIGLIATDSLRVEPYVSPLKVLPIDETRK
jgi:hypothetical protein